MNAKHSTPKFWKINPNKRRAMAKTIVELYDENEALRDQLARLILKCQNNNLEVTDEEVPSMV